MAKMLVAVAALLCSTAASAQTTGRWYASASASMMRVSAQEVNAGGGGAVGAGVGFRLTRVLSVEFEADRGLGELSRIYSGKFISFAGPNATREEIDRLAVTMRSDTRWKPQFGWSLLAVVRSKDAAPVGLCLFGGVTSSRYDERRTFTVLDIPEGVDRNEADLHRMVPDDHGSRVRRGVTGGVLVPIRTMRQLSIAPELRFTYGSFGDEVYSVLRAGARLMWNF